MGQLPAGIRGRARRHRSRDHPEPGRARRRLNAAEAEAIAAQVVAARPAPGRPGSRLGSPGSVYGAARSTRVPGRRRERASARRESGAINRGKPIIRPQGQPKPGPLEIARAANRAPRAPRPCPPTPAYLPAGGGVSIRLATNGRGRGGRGGRRARARGGRGGSNPPGFIWRVRVAKIGGVKTHLPQNPWYGRFASRGGGVFVR